MPLTHNCLGMLIYLLTGFYNSTGTYSTSLWLAFLASIQQEKALEHTFVELNGMKTHCRIYTGSLQKLIPLYL